MSEKSVSDLDIQPTNHSVILKSNTKRFKSAKNKKPLLGSAKKTKN
jgi:hypothetical protein